jgi:hypothetical protein
MLLTYSHLGVKKMRTINDILSEEDVLFYNKMFRLIDRNEDFGKDFLEINNFSLEELLFIKANIKKFEEVLNKLASYETEKGFDDITYFKTEDMPIIQFEDRWSCTKGRLDCLIALEIAESFFFEMEILKIKEKMKKTHEYEKTLLESLY